MRRIATFAVFALLAAGCTSGGDPGETLRPTSTFTPPTYSTAPASPSVATTGPNVRPGEKPPVLPAVGRTNTPAGARAFAVFYIEALDWGYATMDSTLARSLFAKSCGECLRFDEIIDRAHRAGDHFRGGRITITRVVLADNDHRDGATQAVDVTYSQGAVVQVTSDGTVDARAPALHNLIRRVWLRWGSRVWVIVDTRKVVQR